MGCFALDQRRDGLAERAAIDLVRRHDGHAVCAQHGQAALVFRLRKASLHGRRSGYRLTDLMAGRRRKVVEPVAIGKQQGHAEEVRGETHVAMGSVQAKIDEVGQGILLRIDLMPGDGAGEILHVDDHGNEAESREDPLVQGIVECAQAQTPTILERAQGTDPVRDMAEPVVPVRKNAESGALRHIRGKAVPECAVERTQHLSAIADREGKVENAERGYA